MDYDKIAKRVASGRIRTAGTIEFKKDQGPIRRDIRVREFDWSSSAHKDLAKILWAAQRSHSYAMAAYRIFSRMSSSDYSPDGLLGGRGYIQNIKDLRSNMSSTVEFLSSFSDTLHDEVSAPHWKNAATPEVEEIVDNTEQLRGNPEDYVEEEYEEEVIENPNADVMNPTVEDPTAEEGSQPRNVMEEAAGGPSEFFQAAANRLAGGDSSVPLSTLPGPRVDSIGPAAGDGFEGSFNPPEDWPSDQMDPHSDISKYPGSGEYDLANPPQASTGDGDGSSITGKKKNKEAAASYSWLPGADNHRPMDYYRPGLTEGEVEAMKIISDPTYNPMKDRKKKTSMNEALWAKDVSGAL